MKSINTQIKPNARKNELDEKNMPAGIQTFFKPVPKTFVIDQNIPEAKTNNVDKMYYVGLLKEKLRCEFLFFEPFSPSDNIVFAS